MPASCRRAGLILALLLTAFTHGCGGQQQPTSPAVPPSSLVQGVETKTDPAAGNTESPPEEPPGPFHFTSMLDGSGIDFRHTSGDSKEKPFPAANGSGVAALDYDLDGRYDLYFGNGTTFPIDPHRDTPTDKFYRQEEDWEFSDVTAVSGFNSSEYTAGVAVGDYNSDGFPDLYVAAVGTNQMYCNLGDGTFMEVSAETRTNDPRWSVSTAFADIDSDGHLDLYVCNYAEWSFETNRFCGDQVRGIRMYCSPTLFPPENDVLYRNLADGTFEDASESSGINSPPGRAQGVIAADMNADGLIDIYAANDINANALLMNSGGGRFENVAEATGTAYDHLGRAQASMGLAIADIDRNGLLDLFTTNYAKEHNALYENLGNNNFLECGSTRVPEGSLPYVGWGTAFSDFDLDGWPDLIVTNGHTDDNLHDLGKEGDYLQPPGLWHNQNGLFTHCGLPSGDYFRQLWCGRGLLTADLDNDGDADVVIGHQDSFPALLRNDEVAELSSASLQLRLIGRSDNRDAIGAVVEVLSEDLPGIQPVFGGGSYASASDQRLILATLCNEAELSVNIRWPNGMRSEVNRLKGGERYAIIQPSVSGQSARCISIKVE